MSHQLCIKAHFTHQIDELGIGDRAVMHNNTAAQRDGATDDAMEAVEMSRNRGNT